MTDSSTAKTSASSSKKKRSSSSSSSSSKKKKKPLPPPRYDLPEQFLLESSGTRESRDALHGDRRYELWCVRVPHDLDPRTLHGATVSLPLERGDRPSSNAADGYAVETTTTTTKESSSSSSRTTRLTLLDGRPEEMRDARVLVPDDADGTTTTTTTTKMVPLNRSFERVLRVVRVASSETKATARPAVRVPPDARFEGVVEPLSDDLKRVLKVAYAPKAQVEGLRRRWRAAGSDAPRPDPDARPPKRRRRASFDGDDVDAVKIEERSDGGVETPESKSKKDKKKEKKAKKDKKKKKDKTKK